MWTGSVSPHASTFETTALRRRLRAVLDAMSAIGIVLTFISGAVAQYLAATPGGRLLVKRAWYRIFPELARDHLRSLHGVLESLSKDLNFGIMPTVKSLDNLAEKLAPLGLWPPGIHGDVSNPSRVEEEVRYLYRLSKRPGLLDTLGRKLNDADSPLDFDREQLGLAYDRLKKKL